MKKILFAVCAVVACSAVSAQEQAKTEPAARPVVTETASWPVWLAFNSTKNIDVAGLRINIPYGECESVTGFDLGFFGRCRYFEGMQLNLLRNDVRDVTSGIQIGVYNSAGRGDLSGLQIGLFNEARTIRGIQIGLVNLADVGQGFQIGIINRAESFYGFQAGAVNVIRESELAFMPILNIGFDIFYPASHTEPNL